MSFNYESGFDPDDAHSSHGLALSLIGYNKSVLEVGCATGYFTKVLADRGCDVVGIELDPGAAAQAEEWAQRVVVGDVDSGVVWDDVKDESFDVVVFGDVLEHLRDPLAALRQAVRKLKPSGFVVTSVPNIGHGDARLALLQGRFRYSDFGLLDRTHMRFFTLETIREMLVQAGLVVVDTRRVIMPLFQSELGVQRTDVSHVTVDEILADPEAESYQYVIKSVRDNGTRTLNELSRRVNELSDHRHHEEVRTALLRKEMHDVNSRLEAHQEYVKALEGHAEGLQHNLDTLGASYAECTERLVAVEAQYRAVLGMRTVQMTAPIRWVYNKLKRAGKKSG